MSGIAADLPNYRRDIDYANQEGYQELLNLVLTAWFSSSGFYQPTLTNAQVTQLMSQMPPLANGVHWLNSNLNKMQFVDNTGTVQTVTSV